MSAVWIFPSVISVRGGAIRGRALRRDPDRGSWKLIRNMRSIVFTPELPLANVRLEVCGRVLRARADEEGFFSVVVEASDEPLPLGRHPARAFLELDSEGGKHD